MVDDESGFVVVLIGESWGQFQTCSRGDSGLMVAADLFVLFR